MSRTNDLIELRQILFDATTSLFLLQLRTFLQIRCRMYPSMICTSYYASASNKLNAKISLIYKKLEL